MAELLEALRSLEEIVMAEEPENWGPKIDAKSKPKSMKISRSRFVQRGSALTRVLHRESKKISNS